MEPSVSKMVLDGTLLKLNHLLASCSLKLINLGCTISTLRSKSTIWGISDPCTFSSLLPEVSSNLTFSLTFYYRGHETDLGLLISTLGLHMNI